MSDNSPYTVTMLLKRVKGTEDWELYDIYTNPDSVIKVVSALSQALPTWEWAFIEYIKGVNTLVRIGK